MNLSVLPPWAIPLAAIVGAGILYAIHARQVHNASTAGYARGHDAATQAMERKVAAANADARAAEQVSQKRVLEAQQAYASSMDSLNARYRGADQSLRLCERAKARAVAAVSVPAVAGATARGDARAARDELPGAAAGDPRADLTWLMRVADEQALQLQLCQGYAAGVRAAPSP